MTIRTLARPPRSRDERSFLLQRAQPAMTGLDGWTVRSGRGELGRTAQGPGGGRKFG